MHIGAILWCCKPIETSLDQYECPGLFMICGFIGQSRIMVFAWGQKRREFDEQSYNSASSLSSRPAITQKRDSVWTEVANEFLMAARVRYAALSTLLNMRQKKKKSHAPHCMQARGHTVSECQASLSDASIKTRSKNIGSGFKHQLCEATV